MKPKLILFGILFVAMSFSFSKTAKPRFPLQTNSNNYLNDAKTALKKKDCRWAKANYQMYIASKGAKPDPVYDEIKDCLKTKGLTLSGFDSDIYNDLMPFEANLQPKNNANVDYGNQAFNDKSLIKAAGYFLRYLTENEYLFKNDPDKKEDFMKKIEYCLSGIN